MCISHITHPLIYYFRVQLNSQKLRIIFIHIFEWFKNSEFKVNCKPNHLNSGLL